MDINVVTEGKYVEIEADNFITLCVSSTPKGIYCSLELNEPDILIFVKDNQNKYNKMIINKGILKGVEVKILNNCLDISHILKYVNVRLYKIEHLKVMISTNYKTKLNVYKYPDHIDKLN